jgi:hypothetical protein
LGIATTGGLLSSSIYIILFMPAFIFLFEKLQTFGSILTNGFLKGLIGDN